MVNYDKHSKHNRPIAAVYRGKVACDGCAEAVAHLLRKSPMKYKVHYLGPKEHHDITKHSLAKLDLFAWPGGGDDENADFLKVAQYKKHLDEYLQEGGKFAGFCLGAFFAKGKLDNQTFFDLLPKGSYVSGERFQPGAQVKDTKDTIILTDWTFGSGKRKGETIKNRWQYFQDGAQIHLTSQFKKQSKVLGRYVNTSDPSAVIVPYGKGSVGLIGFHPEADQSWYDDYNIHNPQNVSFELGYDFLRTLYESQGRKSSTQQFLAQKTELYNDNLFTRSELNDLRITSSSIHSAGSMFNLLLVAIPFLAILMGLRFSRRHNFRAV